jgi:Ala-tRNA(Pro) deacylase
LFLTHQEGARRRCGYFAQRLLKKRDAFYRQIAYVGALFTCHGTPWESELLWFRSGEIKMTTLQKCLNYLDTHAIRYAHTTHSPAYTAEEVAAAEHMPPHRMAKTVVFQSNDGYLMVVVPADSYVDREQVRTAVGVSSLYKAEETELCLLFPTAEIGAMPALGNLFRLPVYLDREVADQEFIAFNAGTHRDLLHMRTADFSRLVQPIVGHFGRPSYELDGILVNAEFA